MGPVVSVSSRASPRAPYFLRAPENCTLKRAAQVYIMAPCMTLATAFFRAYLGPHRLICLSTAFSDTGAFIVARAYRRPGCQVMAIREWSVRSHIHSGFRYNA